MKRILIAALALMSTAGGVVPQGMGAWKSGGRGIIPLDTRLMRYRWDNGFDATWRDRITFAVADIDREFPTVRFAYALGTCDTPYQFHFDIDTTPAPPECSDDISGNCTVARTTCSQGGEFVSAGYRVCNMLRVTVYVDRVRVVALDKGVDEASYAHSVLRHEMGHVLGLPETYNLGQTVAACPRALVETYLNDPNSAVWLDAPLPAECQ